MVQYLLYSCAIATEIWTIASTLTIYNLNKREKKKIVKYTRNFIKNSCITLTKVLHSFFWKEVNQSFKK